MKKELIITSLLALSGIASAQTWGGSGTTSGSTYRYGNVGIGKSSPNNALDIRTTQADGGITITQRNEGGAAIHLVDSVPYGRKYGIFSYGGATYGGGFGIYDYEASAFRFHIDSTGNTGIGTAFPGAKLHVVKNVIPGGNHQTALLSNITQIATIGGGSHLNYTAVDGNAISNMVGESYMYGVSGSGANGLSNYGGAFSASGGNNSYTNYWNYAVSAIASGNGNSIGVYGKATGATYQNWAGYFDGNVNINGNAYCTTSAWSSDLKLKKEIKLLSNSMEKIRQLKPSSYLFKTDEFKDMNLPAQPQLGLIAQELEVVFPDLVVEVAERIQRDNKGNVTTQIPAHKMINYIGLIPVLIGGIQEQQKTIDQQTQINADLQKQLDEQKELINSMKNSGTTGINAAGNVETGFQMSQNEPNPFTHETVVKYTLPQSVNTAFMAVYDLTGKQIATFPIQQKGASSLTVTSEKLSAGIYIYSIVADGKVVDSKRMIVADK